MAKLFRAMSYVPACPAMSCSKAHHSIAKTWKSKTNQTREKPTMPNVFSFCFLGQLGLPKLCTRAKGTIFLAHVEQLPCFPKKLVASNEKNEFRTCPFFFCKKINRMCPVSPSLSKQQNQV